ncbi:MAG: type II toxin-antitoxin system VapC family toxin [Deltaproteobacteria bacterium]|nr:type II toxin-antitoxin system VapC family toxin [Deltaproteobacteria bacterium]
MRDEITLHAPSLIDWEFVNAMWVADRTGRIVLEDRDAAVQNFLRLDVGRTPCSDLSASILSVATESGRSCYDSAYLALSKTTGAPWVTGDKRLFNATKRNMESVIWIGHLRVP